MATLSPSDFGPILSPTTALAIILALMVILPIVPIVVNTRRGEIDLDVSDQQQRTKFFLFSAGCYGLAWSMFALLACHIFAVLAAAYLAVVTSLIVLNTWTKVSVHAAGVAGPSTALIYLYGPQVSALVLLWGLVVWSRVKLRQHTVRQGVLGVIAGMLVTYAVYALLY